MFSVEQNQLVSWKAIYGLTRSWYVQATEGQVERRGGGEEKMKNFTSWQQQTYSSQDVLFLGPEWTAFHSLLMFSRANRPWRPVHYPTALTLMSTISTFLLSVFLHLWPCHTTRPGQTGLCERAHHSECFWDQKGKCWYIAALVLARGPQTQIAHLDTLQETGWGDYLAQGKIG